jgi:selenobiotic family peptide radical SAM maturase
MKSRSLQKNIDYFNASRRALKPGAWKKVLAFLPDDPSPDAIRAAIQDYCAEYETVPWLSDLALLESTMATVAQKQLPKAAKALPVRVNPTLALIPLGWCNLPEHLLSAAHRSAVEPVAGEAYTMVWRMPGSGELHTATATDSDLLALKIVLEKLTPEAVAQAGGPSAKIVPELITVAAGRGILLAPPSAIKRDALFPRGTVEGDEHFISQNFTLQWHITQTCDLRCTHCYDRSDRSPMPLDQGLRVLDDLKSFCGKHHVFGHVSFTGGNPFLYPHFFELYQRAADLGFGTVILGNPVAPELLERMLSIQPPSHFQISLEGLGPRNDAVRGKGHFKRSLAFLKLLKKFSIHSMVMLTLTNDNIDDVLPLAEKLRGYADTFHFNRLAMVGEGANLRLPDTKKYKKFLADYIRAAKMNPIMGYKDSLLNVMLHDRKQELFGGCAGYGCGAAFNFVALLPDGEVHACRKFPSKIGNMFEQPLEKIYRAALARRYRSGCSACASCSIRPVCGGCLAVAYGCGLDVFNEKDPMCFLKETNKS